MYTVKHAAVLTGITPATLRMWERRYGVVSPVRSAGGYREYDDAAISRLTAMRALVDAGSSPRLAAERVTSGTTAGPVDDGRPEESEDHPAPPAGADLDVLVTLASEFDGPGLVEVLDEKFRNPDFEALVDAWLMPALQRMGAAWHRGSVTVAGEHFVTAGVQRRLSAALDASPVNAGAPVVMVGLARGSRHELGVLTFAVALRRAGVQVVYVGGDLPPESWVVTVASCRPDGIVLGVPASDDVAAVRDTVGVLAAIDPALPVFLGGRHQDQVGGAAETLGHDLSGAAREVAARLGVVLAHA